MKRKKIYGIFMLVAIAVFLFAGERILQIYLNYQESQKVYEQMEGFTQKIEDQDLSPEAVPGETPEEVAEQGFLQVDFNKLEEINPDVIAWIEIPGLEISYPVVQGRDNDYYLHHLITGENHKSGSIFMDFQNQEDLSDRNTIIYGHNMKDILNKIYKKKLLNAEEKLFLKCHDGLITLQLSDIIYIQTENKLLILHRSHQYDNHMVKR